MDTSISEKAPPARDEAFVPDQGSVSSAVSESEGDGVDRRCGYFFCKPDCLQGCAKTKWMLAVMSAYVFIETFVQWGLVNVNIATWERRYQLKSTQSAWIITSQDLTQGVIGPIVGYLGAYYHKGRMMSAGCLSMVVGSMLFLVPQIATDPYQLSGAYKDETCDLSANSSLLDVCDEGLVDTNLDIWLGVFCLAQIFFGYTSCSIWTIGVTYIDDNLSSDNSTLFLGIFNMFSALGSALGFLLGGLFLGIYVDVFKVDMDQVDLEPSDPRWVGAWWMGFAVSLVLSIPILFLLLLLPRELPAVAEIRKAKESEAHKGAGLQSTTRQDFGKTCSDLGLSLKLVLGNAVFIVITLGGILELGGVTAFAAFLPKIFQFQFGLTASMSALLAGAVVVPGAAIGQLLGGIIPKAMTLKLRGIFLMMITCQVICILCSFSFLLTCPFPGLAGYSVDYPYNSTVSVEDDPFIQTCNDDCNCTTLEYIPICATDGVTYFNPCYAGCADKVETESTTYYGNCSCIQNASSVLYQAQSGMCDSSCSKFWIFLPFFLIVVICTFIENTGGYALVLRVVPEKQRTFAFGIQGPLIRFLGTVPIPIIFGLVFDLACEVWQDNCGSQGSCWIYDSQFLAVGLFIGVAAVKVLAGICFVSGVIIYRAPKQDTSTTDEIIVDVPVKADSDSVKIKTELALDNKAFDYNNTDLTTTFNGHLPREKSTHGDIEDSTRF